MLGEERDEVLLHIQPGVLNQHLRDHEEGLGEDLDSQTSLPGDGLLVVLQVGVGGDLEGARTRNNSLVLEDVADLGEEIWGINGEILGVCSFIRNSHFQSHFPNRSYKRHTNCATYALEPVPECVLHLVKSVFIGSGHEDGTGGGVLGLFHERELVVLDLVLVDEAGPTEVGLIQIIHRVNGVTAAGEAETGGRRSLW